MSGWRILLAAILTFNVICWVIGYLGSPMGVAAEHTVYEMWAKLITTLVLAVAVIIQIWRAPE